LAEKAVEKCLLFFLERPHIMRIYGKLDILRNIHRRAMKNKFAWYLDNSSTVAESIWNRAILTVDANVLLDLYRYHSATRDSILAALASFSPRIWISHQAASEFFANRKRVIASAEKTFREAQAALDEFNKSLDGGTGKLRGYRLVPRTVVEGLEKELGAALEQAKKEIADATEKHPNYLETDPILERVLELFEGRVGEPENDADRSRLIQEAELRFKAKIPPGYLDTEKEGDRKFGDFLFWSQTIRQAKDAKLPFVLVTSEQKEDWWEKQAGRTLGPRMELIREFSVATNQPIFIYQTDNFLEISARHAGQNVTSEVVEEIREINARRRNFRPSAAVKVEQSAVIAEENNNFGILEIELLREVGMMTGSGHFEPELQGVPKVKVDMIRTPDGCGPIEVTANTGTRFDFNVHVRAAHGSMLPVGKYEMIYDAVPNTPGTGEN